MEKRPCDPLPARLNIYPASESNKVLIIARVRSKLYHIVVWDYDSDELIRGSWFRGKLITEALDVSPDGRHMVYSAIGPSKGVYAWTAVSEAPWTEALLFWPHGDTILGGGLFMGNELWINISREVEFENRSRHEPSRNIEKLYRLKFRDEVVPAVPPFIGRMKRDGWSLESDQDGERGYVKLCGGMRLSLFRRDSGDTVAAYGLFLKDTCSKLSHIVGPRTRWTDFDNLGRLLTVEGDGKIRRFAREDLDSGEPSCIVDCNFDPAGKV